MMDDDGGMMVVDEEDRSSEVRCPEATGEDRDGG
jgi:hypothetical protein